MRATPVIARGTHLGPYEVLALLDTGGMGEVYRARDPRLGRDVAVKVVTGELAGSEEARRRFDREARAVAALSHPNVLSIYDFGCEKGRLYAVTELLEGETLRQRLRRGALPWRRAVEVAEAIAEGLAAAHAKGIVHRDLKPANVFLTSDGRVKVLDFGLAKLGEPTDACDSASPTQSKTEPGKVMGTVGYMSPEQVRGAPADHRSDIFALGCVLFEMVTGVRAFSRGSDAETMAAILDDEPPYLTATAKAPPELSRLVAYCLAKESDARFQSAGDLALALRSLLGAPAADSGGPRRGLLVRGRRPAAAVAGLLVVALLGAVSLALLRWRKLVAIAPPPEIASVAVLPFRSIGQGTDENYVGLGLANDIITQVSQMGGVTVRPTSAVRKYADDEVDALAAARRLQVDAVLDGTWQRGGDRRRVSVNLLRVRDGVSLWAESFDSRETDVFAIQDTIARQVASRLKLRLASNTQARLAGRQTSNTEAYEAYTKAIYYFADRYATGLAQRGPSDRAIGLLRRAIALDPGYALARAQLAYAYAWTATNFDDDFELIEKAKHELATAESLHPLLPETHVARSLIVWSPSEGWQTAEAIRELRLAQQFNLQVGHLELSELYFHIGLDEQMLKEKMVAIEVDPTNDVPKTSLVAELYLSARPDEARAAAQRLRVRDEELRYYLEKRMRGRAAPLLDKWMRDQPASPWLHAFRARLLALEGKHGEAQALVPWILKEIPRNRRWYHHITYEVARIYASGGKSDDAVKWLRVTAKEGFPCYTLFLRDSVLDPIRQAPAFVQFMAEMKTTWEGYQREVG